MLMNIVVLFLGFLATREKLCCVLTQNENLDVRWLLQYSSTTDKWIQCITIFIIESKHFLSWVIDFKSFDTNILHSSVLMFVWKW